MALQQSTTAQKGVQSGGTWRVLALVLCGLGSSASIMAWELFAPTAAHRSHEAFPRVVAEVLDGSEGQLALQPDWIEPERVAPTLADVVLAAPPESLGEPSICAWPREEDPVFGRQTAWISSEFPALPLVPAAGSVSSRARQRGTMNAPESASQRAVRLGLEWLRVRQLCDGRWGSDDSPHIGSQGRACACRTTTSNAGDIGDTALALLAFQGDGNTTRAGPYKDVVSRGIQWLREQQDKDTGLIGGRVGNAFAFDHALATLAVCEAYYFTKNPLSRSTAQDALRYMLREDNTHVAWSIDRSATGWILLALDSAERGGLRVQRGDCSAFFADFGIDAAVGHDGTLSASDGLSNLLGARRLAGGTLVLGPERYFDHLAAQSRETGRSVPWRDSLERSLWSAQCLAGELAGSWDPPGVGATKGSRVASTALALLALQVPIRFARVEAPAPDRPR